MTKSIVSPFWTAIGAGLVAAWLRMTSQAADDAGAGWQRCGRGRRRCGCEWPTGLRCELAGSGSGPAADRGSGRRRRVAAGCVERVPSRLSDRAVYRCLARCLSRMRQGLELDGMGGFVDSAPAELPGELIVELLRCRLGSPPSTNSSASVTSSSRRFAAECKAGTGD